MIADVFEIPDGGTAFELTVKVRKVMERLTGRRRLLIIHYAGHGVRGCILSRLELTPKIGQDEDFERLHGLRELENLVPWRKGGEKLGCGEE